MGKLAAALAWAARGFRVFPLQVDSKDPLDMPWTEAATTDEAVIRAWWTDPVLGTERENNIGFLTTGWVVLDVDLKKDGPAAMGRLGIDFDTLATRTVSGGYHLVYDVGGREFGQSPIAPGIDVRARNGYVVAPGSTVGGRPYEVLHDLPVAPFPEHVAHLLRPPRERTRREVEGVVLDSPEVIGNALHWTQRSAPTAFEGERGITCYKVAARLREYGLSEAAAVDMLVEHWNDRNQPPMPPHELEEAVAHAYRYATGDAGSLSPQAMFGHVVALPPPAQADGDLVERILYGFGRMVDVKDIEARPWIVDRLLLEGVVTNLVSAGGGGKSTFTLEMAAHLACGRDFLGLRCLRPGKSIVYNAEDDIVEASRRLHAICDVFGLDKETVNRGIALVSSDDVKLQIVKGRPLDANAEAVMPLLRAASDPDVRLVSIDPLVEVHDVNENDNMEMAFVMGILRHIAREARVAVCGVHHTGKPSAAASTFWVGNQNAGRGSSAVPAAARIVLTLFPASDADCEEIGVPPAEKGHYVRLDGAKANFSAPGSGRPRWLRWRSHALASGDNMGVLVEHDATRAHGLMLRELVDMLRDELVRSGTASFTLDEALAAARRRGLLLGREEPHVAKRRLRRLVEESAGIPDGVGIAADGGQVRIVIA